MNFFFENGGGLFDAQRNVAVVSERNVESATFLSNLVKRGYISPNSPRQQQGRCHQGVRRGPGGHLHQPAGSAGAPAVAGRQDGSADPAHGAARGQGRPVLGQQLLRVQQEQGPRGREGVGQVVGGQQRTAVLRGPRPAGAGAEVRGREPLLQQPDRQADPERVDSGRADDGHALSDAVPAAELRGGHRRARRARERPLVRARIPNRRSGPRRRASRRS